MKYKITDEDNVVMLYAETLEEVIDYLQIVLEKNKIKLFIQIS